MYLLTRNILMLQVLLIFSFSAAMAQQRAEYIFPSATFNESAASGQMQDGSSLISGTAKLRKKGVDYFPWQGNRINLYPITPYLLEFIALRKKYNKGKKIAALSNEAFTYRIEGKIIDNNGTFEFRDLRPGKYYITTWITYEKKASYKVESGTSTRYNMYGEALYSTPIYWYYTYKYAVEDEVTGIVEVKNDGETVTVLISK